MIGIHIFSIYPALIWRKDLWADAYLLPRAIYCSSF